MKRSTLLKIRAVTMVMTAGAIAFFRYALSHPESSFSSDAAAAMVMMYLVVVVILIFVSIAGR